MTSDQRSAIMRSVRSKDTAPEMRVRCALHARGFRFRLHRRDLPGKPDIVLSRFRTCIFVHGCFWHGHEGCRKASLPKTNTDFWTSKITRNQERDRESRALLENAGWKVLTVWECRTKTAAELEKTIEEIVLELSSSKWRCRDRQMRETNIIIK